MCSKGSDKLDAKGRVSGQSEFAESLEIFDIVSAQS